MNQEAIMQNKPVRKSLGSDPVEPPKCGAKRSSMDSIH